MYHHNITLVIYHNYITVAIHNVCGVGIIINAKDGRRWRREGVGVANAKGMIQMGGCVFHKNEALTT